MRPTQHPTNNRVLGAPVGWDQQGGVPCSALPITDARWGEHRAVLSFWQPTTEELVALQRGAMVALAVMGGTMPPVAVYVDAV